MKTILLTLSLMMALPTFAYDFIQVSGEGEVKVKPDHVFISANVFSRAPTASAATKANSKEMARVEKILKQDFKIEAKDIQTSSFQVQPQYEYAKDRPVFRGMTVTHFLKIKYRKVDEVGALLDKLLEGQSQETLGLRIEEISFGSDQLRSYQTQALESAVAEAKSRAQVLAKASNRSLGVIRRISDSQIVEHQPRPAGMEKRSMMAMDMESSSTSVSPGELTVKANVHAEFEIK